MIESGNNILSLHIPSPPKLQVFYIDSNVLLNYLGNYGKRNEMEAAKRFLKSIQDGKRKGIVSTWALMEIITVIRKALALKGKTDFSDIEPIVDQSISAIYKIRNLKIVSGTPLEMSKINSKPPLLWEIFEKALDHMSNSMYDVEWNDKKKLNEIVGIGSNDAVHILLAVHFGCDYLATFDKGFWVDTRPITIFDVYNNTER